MTLEHKMLFDSLDPNSGYLFIRDLLNFAFDGVIPEPESETFRKIRLEIQERENSRLRKARSRLRKAGKQERENSRLRKARSRLRKAGKPVDPVPAPVPVQPEPVPTAPAAPVPEPPTDEKKIKSRAFGRIWNIYPKKTGMVFAERAFLSAFNRETDKGHSPEEVAELFVSAIEQYSATVKTYSMRERRYIFSLQNFMDGGHYFDDPETWKRNGGTPDPAPADEYGTLPNGVRKKRSVL